MSDPEPYRWEYDRVAAEEILRRGYDTFSVGVFQLLPKASGKGLKRSTSIRIVGYTAEPEKVLERADELCRQLNDARARADQPPAWLQRQYSVVKPVGYVVERTSDDLTGAQVRSLRERVMKDELLPVGFVKGEGGTYVRRRGEQIHLIDFQPNKYGHTFTVNLAFNYTFVPPPFHCARVSLRELHLLDCVLRARIGSFLPENHDTWFPYGAHREALREVFVRCAAESLLVLDGHAELWADPRVVIALAKAEPCEPWDCSHRDLVIGAIEMRLGRLDDAEASLSRWIAGRKAHTHAKLYEMLIGELRALRDGSEEAKRVRNDLSPLDWVAP